MPEYVTGAGLDRTLADGPIANGPPVESDAPPSGAAYGPPMSADLAPASDTALPADPVGATDGANTEATTNQNDTIWEPDAVLSSDTSPRLN